jgi:uncharacterized protein YndB with AHSA1/START domain
MSESDGERRVDSATRVVSAEASEVFAAFADAAALMAWLPPGGMHGRAIEYDFRTGGRYRIELTYAGDSQQGKTSARTDVSAGRFVAIEPGRRIVQSVEFESSDASFAGEMLMTWTFEPLTAGTRVTIRAENVPPGITRADHDEGLRSSLDNLARHVG